MKMRFVAWGAYDDSKPRVRLLLDAVRREDRLEVDLHADVWTGVADKSVAQKRQLLGAGWRYLTQLPRLCWKLSRLKGDTPVLLPYPGTPDIFLAKLIAYRRGRKLVLDAFLPIHDTIVRDRKMVREGGLIAKFLRGFERAGLRCADVILVDTDAHGAFFSREYDIPLDRFVTVPVGAEPLFDAAADSQSVADFVGDDTSGPIVLFYGQFIPLHGLQTILEAARLDRDSATKWVVVGTGQQEKIMRDFLAEGGSDSLMWLKWVDYQRLPDLIARADVCLGIFGGSDKASRVIPNKVFQCLAMGKSVVTRSSPAIDALAAQYPGSLLTVPPEDPEALAQCVATALANPASLSALPTEALAEFGPEMGIAKLVTKLERQADSGS